MDHSIGLIDLTLSWGIITQCLSWGGVVDWGFIAVWMPFVLALIITFIAALILVASD